LQPPSIVPQPDPWDEKRKVKARSPATAIEYALAEAPAPVAPQPDPREIKRRVTARSPATAIE
jgi:hypothetical protein